MKAQQLLTPTSVDRHPLSLTELPRPQPRPDELLLRVQVCGMCHTDLHIVEGDLDLPKLPITPGHQIVGRVEHIGGEVTRFSTGDRVGVPWLYSTCGVCEFCKAGKENLCDNARFTGLHADGGYAEYVCVKQDFAYSIPEAFADSQAAPLLCAGVIGYRALRLSDVQPGQRIGLYGFGASAHIAIQIARYWRCEVFVFTRSQHHRELATSLGAAWVGNAGETPPHKIESAIIFAPAGKLVPEALKVLNKGGTVALAGIHMSPIPAMEYKLLYGERTLRSVANSTRQDVRELLDLAAEIPVRTEVEQFPLIQANDALMKLKRSEIQGSGVLQISDD
jgi:alcohol dehydrogenase, propanol-preferring